jgi:hypothetical protein
MTDRNFVQVRKHHKISAIIGHGGNNNGIPVKGNKVISTRCRDGGGLDVIRVKP